ncbi:Beta-galactoside-binding lectin, partial [Nibea albiflora]
SAQGMIIKNMSFKVGQTLTVVGVAKPEATKLLFREGQWCQEHREGGFPFRQGEEFKIVIEFTPTEFKVTLSDGSTINFPNRMGADKYSIVSFDGDVRVRSFEIK